MSFTLDQIEEMREEKLEKIKNKILVENIDKMNAAKTKIHLVFRLQYFQKKFRKLDDDMKHFVLMNLKIWANYNCFDNLKEIVNDLDSDFNWTKLAKYSEIDGMIEFIILLFEVLN